MKPVVLNNYLLTLIFCFSSGQAPAEDLDSLVKTSREIINTYALGMQFAYENAFRQNDLQFVKEVCEKTARENAVNLGKNGWQLQRVNLHSKNSMNTPDRTEKRILQDFLKKQSQGKSVEELSWYKLHEAGNQSEFHYMRAFKLEQRCMSCHAQNSSTDETTNLAAYSLKKIETKDYFPDTVAHDKNTPLPEYQE